MRGPEKSLPSQEKLLVLTAGAGNILRIAPALTVRAPTRSPRKITQFGLVRTSYSPLGGGNSKNFGIVTPYLEKIPILTNIFQRSWKHQLDLLGDNLTQKLTRMTLQYLQICENQNLQTTIDTFRVSNFDIQSSIITSFVHFIHSRPEGIVTMLFPSQVAAIMPYLSWLLWCCAHVFAVRNQKSIYVYLLKNMCISMLMICKYKTIKLGV